MSDEIVEVVIDEETAKTFEVKAVVFYMDANNQLARGQTFDKAKLVVENPVPVTSSSGEVIGSATLYVEDKKVYAEMFIDYSTPERLTLETEETKLYPTLDAYSELLDGKRSVGKLIVSGVILQLAKPSDDRIEHVSSFCL